MGGDFSSRFVREPLIIVNVVDVVMRVEDESDRVAVLRGGLLKDPRVKARIEHGGDLRLRIPDDISEVRHRANQALLEPHPCA